MVAPSYAQARSEMALRIGLGRPKQPARPGKGAAPERTATKRTRRVKAAAKQTPRAKAAAE
jgi:hypothetical protein